MRCRLREPRRFRDPMILVGCFAAALLWGALGHSRAHAQCPPRANPALFPDDTALGAATPLANTPTMTTSVTRSYQMHQKLVGAVTHDASYCVYRPATPAAVRVLVLFMHGFFPELGGYDAIAQQFAEYGYHVVYPRLGLESFNVWGTLAEAALRHALNTLSGQGIQNVVIMGHSLGAMAATRTAALYGTSQPALKALLLNDPATLDPTLFPAINSANDYNFAPACLATIPCTTRLLITETEEVHRTVGTASPTLWNNIQHIPLQIAGTFRRNYLVITHDVSHLGSTTTPANTWVPALHSDLWPDPYDYRDYNGMVLPNFGALFEAVNNVAFGFYSPLCNTSSASGLCASTRYRGVWRSDNVAATPLKNFGDLLSAQGAPDAYTLRSQFPLQCGTQAVTRPSSCAVR